MTTGVSGILAVTLQRRLAVRDVVLPLSTCEAVMAELFDVVSDIAAVASKSLASRPRPQLVETAAAPAHDPHCGRRQGHCECSSIEECHNA